MALVSSDGARAAVLEFDGPALRYLEHVDAHVLRYEEFAGLPPGLWVWEGDMRVSATWTDYGHEYDEWLEGAHRLMTAEEWDRYIEDGVPWERTEFCVVHAGTKGANAVCRVGEDYLLDIPCASCGSSQPSHLGVCSECGRSDMPEEVFDAPGAKCLRVTPKAVLVQAPDLGDEPVWIPHACLHDDSEVYRLGDEGRLVVVRWFAESKGWL